MSFRSLPTAHKQDSDLDLKALRIFVAIAESGSFIAGGKARGLTRSAAGKAVARLEAHLGTRLFHRTTRSLSLTVDGQRFYERSIQILQDLAEAESSIRQDSPQPSGTLRMTVSEIYGRAVILPFLNKFLEQWPELDVEISFTDRIVDVTEEGFDLSIRIGEVAQDSLLIARVIEHAKGGMYAAPDYLENFGTPNTPEDLANHQRLIYGLNPRPGSWALTAPDGESILINGGRLFRFDSGEAIREAAILGMGIAFLPSSLLEADIDAGRLVKLLPSFQGPTTPIQVIYPSRKHLAAKIRQFIDGLVEYRNAPQPPA
ncbi:LysR family transcriptional regulator [Aliidiomarina soli]|uniref:LysR family transcriptional regulator n=1 Tax=Aliidiomarina soli TaxID=1928574 RepID=A0A432WM77_9GAMM|nr:LysR family transcriptional regulator [Aliidiomarina soli]RUO34864.1 LysR family transcriptional regulator [Aliidiomarina soli]